MSVGYAKKVPPETSEPLTVRWLDVASLNSEEVARVWRQSGLTLSAALAACRISEHNPVEECGDALFISRRVPNFINGKRQEIHFSVAGLIVGPDFIVTVHRPDDMGTSDLMARITQRQQSLSPTISTRSLALLVLEHDLQQSLGILEQVGERLKDWHALLRTRQTLPRQLLTDELPLLSQRLEKIRDVSSEYRRMVDFLRSADFIQHSSSEAGDALLSRLEGLIQRTVEVADRRQHAVEGLEQAHTNLMASRNNKLITAITVAGVPALLVSLLSDGMQVLRSPGGGWAFAAGVIVLSAGAIWARARKLL